MYYDPRDDFDYEEQLRRDERLEALAEDGLGWCERHQATYDLTETGEDRHGCPTYDDPGCPRCARFTELRAAVECGEVDPDAVCYACGEDEATTTLLDRPICAACRAALAEGRWRPDTCTFADPGGRSALRAAGPGNPRVHACPTCGAPNRLTPQDVARGYQCDACADRAEGRYVGGDY